MKSRDLAQEMPTVTAESDTPKTPDPIEATSTKKLIQIRFVDRDEAGLEVVSQYAIVPIRILDGWHCIAIAGFDREDRELIPSDTSYPTPREAAMEVIDKVLELEEIESRPLRVVISGDNHDQIDLMWEED